MSNTEQNQATPKEPNVPAAIAVDPSISAYPSRRSY